MFQTIVSLSVALAIPLSAASATASDTGFLDQSAAVHGRTYRFQVYVPADYSTSKPWPLIVDLHGNTIQGDDALLATKVGLGDAIRTRRDAYPVICVFPQAPKGRFWEEADMQELIMAEIDQVVKEFRIDPSRQYLTGYSMGAAGTYRLAFKYPQRFAAFVTGAGTIQSIPANLGSWIFHGNADTVVDIAQSRQLVKALKDAGGNLRYTELPDASHVDGYRQMWTTSGLIEWLLAQRVERQ